MDFISGSTLVNILIGMAILGAYRYWRDERAALPDEERAILFWNDERYATLQTAISVVLWLFVIVMVPLLLWLGGLAAELWCWPYC